MSGLTTVEEKFLTTLFYHNSDTVPLSGIFEGHWDTKYSEIGENPIQRPKIRFHGLSK